MSHSNHQMVVSALALICVCSMLTPTYAMEESLQVTKLANVVTIDGRWTTSNEWSDSDRVSMHVVQGPSSTGYVRVKHDSDFLYLLVDFLSDTTRANEQTSTSGSAYDGFEIGIDKDVNNDTNTKCCDVYARLKWENTKAAPNPVEPTWIQGSMSYDATYDPDSSDPHAIYEIAVPLSTFEKNSAVRISVWDQSRGVNMHWPNYAGSWSMSYFGDLVFSDVVVPEFAFSATLALLAAVVTVSTILRRTKRCAVSPRNWSK